jgi:hypothetical protein
MNTTATSAIQNIAQSIAPWGKFAYYGTMILGIFICARGIWLAVKDGGEGQRGRGGGASAAFWHLLSAVILINLGGWFSVFANTLGGQCGGAFTGGSEALFESMSKNMQSAASQAGSAANPTQFWLEIAVSQAQVIGWVFTVYGLNLLRGASDQSSQWRGMWGKAWTHIIFGCMAVDLPDIYPMFASIFGLSPMSLTC